MLPGLARRRIDGNESSATPRLLSSRRFRAMVPSGTPSGLDDVTLSTNGVSSMRNLFPFVALLAGSLLLGLTRGVRPVETKRSSSPRSSDSPRSNWGRPEKRRRRPRAQGRPVERRQDGSGRHRLGGVHPRLRHRLDLRCSVPPLRSRHPRYLSPVADLRRQSFAVPITGGRADFQHLTGQVQVTFRDDTEEVATLTFGLSGMTP